MTKGKLNNTVINYASEVKRGVDVGNGYTKYLVNGQGKRFASTLAFGDTTDFGVSLKEIHRVNHNDEDYLVGDGAVFLGDERYYTNEYKTSLFTALALSCEGLPNPISVDLCVGLPLNQIKRHRDRLIKHLSDLPTQTITVDGNNYIIGLNKVSIFPEGALGVMEANVGTVLTIDVGSGTVNVVEWQGMTPVKETTIPFSMYNLYVEIRNHINRNYGGNLSMKQVEDIIGKDTIKIAQQDVNISSHKKIIARHVDGLVGEINVYFNTRAIDSIKLLGGGSIPLETYFRSHYPNIKLVENSQYKNVEIYTRVLELQG